MRPNCRWYIYVIIETSFICKHEHICKQTAYCFTLEIYPLQYRWQSVRYYWIPLATCNFDWSIIYSAAIIRFSDSIIIFLWKNINYYPTIWSLRTFGAHEIHNSSDPEHCSIAKIRAKWCFSPRPNKLIRLKMICNSQRGLSDTGSEHWTHIFPYPSHARKRKSN